MYKKELNCPICGTKNLHYYCSGKDRFIVGTEKYDISICNDCKLGITNIKIDDMFFKKAYPDSYYKDVLTLGEQLRDVSPQLSFIEQKVHLNSNNQKVLEIGCSDGSLLYYLKKQGLSTFGVEPGTYAFNIAVRRGIRVKKTLDDIEERNFSLILMFDVLEHCPNPINELTRIRELIAQDGMIILGVPNFSSLESRITKSGWFGLEIPRHLFHFSPKAIKKAALVSGLDMIGIHFSRNGFFVKSFVDERLPNKTRFDRLVRKKNVRRLLSIIENVLYLFGNKPYMYVLLRKKAGE